MKSIIKFLTSGIFFVFIISCENNYGDAKSIVNLFPVSNGDKFQYVDRQGNIVIEPQFTSATVFREGLALVEILDEDSRFGFITEDGEFAIKPNYKAATIFSEGISWVISQDSAPAAINKDGEFIFRLDIANQVRIFKDGLAAFSIINDKNEEKWGFVDKNGEIVIAPQFSMVLYFSEGKCAVSNGDKIGFINKEGELVINYQFDIYNYTYNNYIFENKECVVQLGEYHGVIGSDGVFILNPQFSSIQLDGNMYLVEQNSNFGWCDRNGKFIINPQFDLAFPFKDNKITPVSVSGEKFGFIDKEGKFVLNPQFKFASPFNGDLSLVAISNKFGFINKTGKYVVNPQFDEPSTDIIYHMLGLTYSNGDFNSVETDYFNVENILSLLNFDMPEGLTFNSTYYDIMNRFNLKKHQFSRYSNEHFLLDDAKINSDVSYSFLALGTPYRDYDFKQDISPTKYAYSISLKGNGIGKEAMVISALRRKLISYYTSEKQDDERLLKSNKNEISIFISRNNKIIILINKPKNHHVDFDFQVTENRVGPFVNGITRHELSFINTNGYIKKIIYPDDSEGGEGLDQVYKYYDEDESELLLVDHGYYGLSIIGVNDNKYRTDKNIGIGSTLGELRTNYEISKIEHYYSYQSSYTTMYFHVNELNATFNTNIDKYSNDWWDDVNKRYNMSEIPDSAIIEGFDIRW